MFEFLATPEFQTLLANLVLAAIGTVATALAGAIVGFVRSKTDEQQYILLQSIATTAVRAAEQAGLAGTVQNKKLSAYNVVSAYLNQLGIKSVSAQQIDSAIEAAVLTQFNGWKTQPPPQYPFPAFETDQDAPPPEDPKSETAGPDEG